MEFCVTFFPKSFVCLVQKYVILYETVSDVTCKRMIHTDEALPSSDSNYLWHNAPYTNRVTPVKTGERNDTTMYCSNFPIRAIYQAADTFKIIQPFLNQNFLCIGN